MDGRASRLATGRTSGQVAVLRRQALNRALLARQLLLERSDLPALAAVRHLAGMQAQAPNPPYVGLWTRLTDFQPSDLASLISERKVIRVALMRSTIHLVPSDDALAWRPVLQPAVERMYWSTYGRFLEGVDRFALAAAGRALVEEESLTFDQLGKHLLEQWPDRDSAALANEIRASSTLVQVPPRGLWGQSGAARHTTVERWLGRSVDDTPDVAAMVRRYLAAFGPASVQDAQAWSGLTRLRPVIEAMRAELVVFHDENGRELFDLPEAPRPAPETPAPVRFLAEFDNVLLSYADPSRIVSPDHRKRIMTVDGLVAGSVLIDGFVRGSWKIKREKSAATLTVTPFAPLDSQSRAELLDEGAALLAFAAAGLEPRIVVEDVV